METTSRALVATIAIACASHMAVTAPASAADSYGAIAYSPSTSAHGWTYDQLTRGSAERTAMARCRENAGDCVIVNWVRNACSALAVGPKGWGGGWGTSRGLAERYALQSCGAKSGNCKVERWLCSNP